MISVQGLGKRYGAVQAVEGVTFEVGRGEIVGLLGENGAGKTTVMKIITGFLEPTSGSVSVGGIDVVADRIGVQRQIGYLPENAPSYPEMLVQEYLLMMAEFRGMTGADADRAVVEAVRATGLTAWLLRPIASLSKGYKQRVGLAQAIIHRPEVLILDEPTNGLDPVQIVEIRKLIRDLAATTTVILSTHILSEIEAVCSRVVVLIDGELATDAKLADLLRSDSVRLSVASGSTDVAAKLGAVDGVESAQAVGADPEREGYERWAISCASGAAAPTPAIVRAAADAGWNVAAIAPETPSLEQVFRDLTREHVARRTAATGEARP